MFDKILEDMLCGNGKTKEHDGRLYLRLHESSWKSNVGWVTCLFVVEIDENQKNWSAGVMKDVKAIISVNPCE